MASAPSTSAAPLTRSQALDHRLEAIPLRVQLITVLSLLLALALVATTAATALLMKRDLTGRVDSELRAAGPAVAGVAIRYLQQGQRGAQPSLLSGYSVVLFQSDSQPLTLANPTGIKETPAIPPMPPTSKHVRSGKPFTVGSTNGDVDWRVIAGPVSGSEVTYAVAVPLENVDHTVHRLILVTGLIGLAVLLACGLMGWYLLRRAFRPLAQIEDTAAAIAAGDLTQRIPTRVADDEVTSLSRSLNGMLAQIEQSFAVREASEERMRQFVSDASHELRTPLATVRGYAELYRQGAVSRPEDVSSAMGRIEGEAARMGGLVDDLLTLARLDEEPRTTMHPVDLMVLAIDATQDARAQASDRRISLLGMDGQLVPTVVQGSESRLRQVLANLLTNAITHTPAGSPIEVLLGTADAGGLAVIQVRDHGPGIDDDTARKVFERFFRADKARTRERGGSGLGLAIVAAIVAGHDGRVGVAPTPGGGATFVVELPTASSQEAHTAL